MTFLDFFSGIGGFRLGMEMAGHECLGHCEIDKFANQSYKAMHDVRESEWFADNIRDVEPGDLPEADCYCGGFPCQAFSVAGKRGGFEDTRGTLFFEVMRLAAVRKPKYLFLENVAGLLSHDGGKTFGKILNALGQLGYWYEYQVLNSKNHGVPQNRERVFIIGHLGGYSGRKIFPIGQNDRTVADIQRQQGVANCLTARYEGAQATGTYIVEREQYAQEVAIIENFYQNREPREYTKESPTLRADRQGLLVREATKQGYAEACEGDSINLAVPGSETRRGRVGKGVANTLDTSCNQGVIIQTPRGNNQGGLHEIAPTLTKNSYEHNNHLLQQSRVRRLTPRECFRLQGFSDEYFDKARQVNSDSQLYKQAGNSVTTTVIYEIAKRL